MERPQTTSTLILPLRKHLVIHLVGQSIFELLKFFTFHQWIILIPLIGGRDYITLWMRMVVWIAFNYTQPFGGTNENKRPGT